MSAKAMQQTRKHPRIRTSLRAVAGAAALAIVFAVPAAAQQMALMASFPLAGREARNTAESLRARNLLIPVQGITADRLHDTYNDARSGGRVHDAIDIHAPRGTPVLAVTDGVVLKLHHSALGGITIYQLDDDGRTRYYYAHLSAYADGIHEGVPVKKGQVIGYVGDTGNAQPGDYHLHFAIAILHDLSRWWGGDNVNPYDVFCPDR
jgi:murein DD-endopeptidase MepM/ murein hydrolase activator NlpD